MKLTLLFALVLQGFFEVIHGDLNKSCRNYLDILDLLFDCGGEPQLRVGLSCQRHHQVVEVAARSHRNKFI